MPKLTIELVPSTAWYTNVRSNVPKKEWDRLRRIVYQRANYVCEICGGRGNKWPVECHEVWDYDDEKHVQTLVRLIALCPRCHQVKHIGRASVMGNLESCTEHLAKVNEWSYTKAKLYVSEQFTVWEQRSKYEWALDISALQECGDDDGSYKQAQEKNSGW